MIGGPDTDLIPTLNISSLLTISHRGVVNEALGHLMWFWSSPSEYKCQATKYTGTYTYDGATINAKPSIDIPSTVSNEIVSHSQNLSQRRVRLSDRSQLTR